MTEVLIKAASAELVALAVAVRPDWTPLQVQAALVDAKTCDWPWPKALLGMVRLMLDPQARPAELVPPGPDPQRSRRPQATAAPERHAEALAEVREVCADASAKLRAEADGAR